MKCSGCGGALSDEDGVTLVMDDADLREYYCATCKPPGSGYTLSDLQTMRMASGPYMDWSDIKKGDKIGFVLRGEVVTCIVKEVIEDEKTGEVRIATE